MLLSLVDSLRCPAHEAESSLVLSVEQWAGPRIAEGTLGCPLCRARYRIHRGTVYFGGAHGGRSADAGPMDPMRLMAQLELGEPGGLVLLTGRYAGVHDILTDVVEVTVLLLDAAESTSPLAVNLETVDRLPLAAGVLRGAAVDQPRATPAFLDEVARCLRAGGRLVAPSEAAPPYRVRIIAKDAGEWVGEISGITEPIRLRRAARPEM